MALTIQTEGKFAWEFMVSEANGFRSYENVIIDTGALVPGTVLGKITASSKYVILAPGASDGSQTAAAILCSDGVDATSADVTATVLVRDAEVNGSEITWPGGITGGQKTTAIGQLASVGIIVRAPIA